MHRRSGRLTDIHGEQQVLLLVPRQPKLKKDFLLKDQRGARMLLKHKDLSGQDWRVLMAYVSEAQFENWVYMSQAEMARWLEIPRQRVNESVKKLVDKGLLIESGKHGNMKIYRLSAVYFWKGRTNRRYQDAYEQHAIQMRLVE